MSNRDILTAAGCSKLTSAAVPVLRNYVLNLLPSGGSLPADVWESRHRFLVGVTWLHALIIAFLGPMLGYSWEFTFDALFEDGTVLHTVGEGLIVALFAAAATWGSARRAVKATLVGLGLMSASAVLVHLSGGYIELHFHFFVMVAFMALYQDWIPYLLAIVYVAIHHGVVGVIWPEEVYNHTAALNAPWTWAGIHAFFILWAAVGSLIAWRFNEKAVAQTKLVLESVGEGILGFNLQGKVSFINPVARRMLGLDRDRSAAALTEIQVGDAESILPSSELRSSILGPLRNGVVHQQTNVWFQRSDGTSFPADFISTPIIERGQVSGVVVAFRDVTRRRQAEDVLARKAEALARSNDELSTRYRELQTLNEITKSILDSFDVKLMMERILDRAIDIGRFDIGLVRLLDTTSQGFSIVACRGYRDSKNVEHHRRQLDSFTTGVSTPRVMVEKSVHVIDLTQTEGMRTFRKEGIRTLVAVPLRSHEEVLGVIHLGTRTPRDFQESELRILEAIGGQAGIAIQKSRLYEASKNAQEALAAKAEELARSNTELQHFAYIASHDLQEPLRMVASYLQLLERRYKGKFDEEAKEFIDFAVDGAKRMQGLINALLAYSRIGTKGKPFEPTDCGEVLRTTLKNLQLAIEDGKAVVTHDPLPTVMADATQLGQLFQNLIGNAIKFRNSVPPAVHISAQRNGAEWLFSFRDNGIGIDPQYKERIFVIFQRLHSKEEYPGTGIGLALCRKIVERHGGRIWVESEPAKGSQFHFTIPA